MIPNEAPEAPEKRELQIAVSDLAQKRKALPEIEGRVQELRNADEASTAAVKDAVMELQSATREKVVNGDPSRIAGARAAHSKAYAAAEQSEAELAVGLQVLREFETELEKAEKRVGAAASAVAVRLHDGVKARALAAAKVLGALMSESSALSNFCLAQTGYEVIQPNHGPHASNLGREIEALVRHRDDARNLSVSDMLDAKLDGAVS